MASWILIRGGGDLASGVALRLQRVGLRLLVTELPEPLVVRRMAAFAQAVFEEQIEVEGVLARRVDNLAQAAQVASQGHLPVLVDPSGGAIEHLQQQEALLVLVDARMTKRPPEMGLEAAPLVIGLGPGFIAGENCHAVVETQRGHNLGRVYWQGAPEADTGIPERVWEKSEERVLRAPAEGILSVHAQIGDHLEVGQLVAEVSGHKVTARLRGVLRGLLNPGFHVWPGLKIGDVDPRDDPRYCTLVSDKSLSIGGGVLEAILTRPELRSRLWD
jgi:xanthine dehydrogenase accessory factor